MEYLNRDWCSMNFSDFQRQFHFVKSNLNLIVSLVTEITTKMEF